VADIPGSPDVVVLAIPNNLVEEAIREAAGLDAGGCVVLGGGFAEAGEEGVERQENLLRVARDAGLRLLGPNSAGMIDASRSRVLSFLTCLERPADTLRSGPVALISQSGGSASYLHTVAAQRGSGLAFSVSTGNEADLGAGEVLGEVVKRDDVRAVALMLETIRDGKKFIESAELALNKGIPLVVCKVGTSTAGAEIMSTHTGALASPWRRYQALFDGLGITVTETPEELYDVAELMARSTVPEGPGLGIVTHSGGSAVLLADLCERERIDLPGLDDALVEELQQHLQHGAAKNPVDLGGIITEPQRFAEVVEAFLKNPGFPAVLTVSTPHPVAHSPERITQLDQLGSRYDKPLMHLWLGGDLGESGLEDLRRRGLPVTTEIRSAVRALGGLGRLALRRHNRRKDRPQRDPKVLSLLSLLHPSGEGTLNESESKELLAALGFSPARNALASHADDAVLKARDIGWPVVVKLASSTILHKSDSGGVHLNLRSEDEVRRACADIDQAMRAHPGATMDGYLIEEFIPGPEVVMGVAHDPALGPMVLLGTGGVLAEAIDDVAVGLPPIDYASARQMIDSLRAVDLLRGFRGGPVTDEDALAHEVMRLGDVALAYSDQIIEIDLNPVVWAKDKWRLADAVVRLPSN
jgi:acetyltransferase